MNRLSGLPGLMSLLIFSKEDQMKVSYSSMTIKPITVSLLNSCKIINFATDFQGVCGNKRRKRKTAIYILKDEQRTITIKLINNYGTCYQHRRPAE